MGGLKSYIVFPSSEDAYPKNAVILVHGYGANGRDLISLGSEWAHECPDTLFIAPDAPKMCEATPLGQQWFSLADFSMEAMEAQIAIAWKTLSDYIDKVTEDFNIPEKNILLCGFSQGTMMALYTALRRKNNCAGVLGYSGVLLGTDTQVQIAPNKKNLPIHLIHGTNDPVVPSQAWDDAMAFFKEAGFQKITGYKSKGLGHNIDMNGIESGLYFIRECLYRE